MIPIANVIEQADSQVAIRSELTTGTRIENIDSERIWNAESVPREFFCPICSCLLWQPRSCGSCQNLFCEACIRKWLQANTKCPFGCVQYQDKRCSPQIRCLLSNIWVHCQSTGYGCTAILSYDTLEAHQTNQCEYPSGRCRYCENLMLRSEIVAHEHECGQKLGSCPKCNSLVPLFLLEQHRLSCVRFSSQQLVQNIDQLQNFTQPGYTFPPDPPQQNIANWIVNINNYTEEERQIQEEYYNLPWYRCFWSLACLILMNPLDAPQILLTVWATGWGYLLGCILIVFAFCFHNICTSFLSIILFTGLLHNGAPWLLSLWAHYLSM
ncbi:unnamed protein product [Adineta steineri]|uniref:RING-type domain-containing protein n=1 Tax=Adineta steineri TaxID=433720 RepID=A0A819R4T5_9BILA|nr:unnamed protein product [Adineta steineri]